MAEPQLRLTLFGEFGLVFQDTTAFSFSGDQPISLSAYLLLHRQTAVPHSERPPMFWLQKDAC